MIFTLQKRHQITVSKNNFLTEKIGTLSQGGDSVYLCTRTRKGKEQPKLPASGAAIRQGKPVLIDCTQPQKGRTYDAL